MILCAAVIALSGVTAQAPAAPAPVFAAARRYGLDRPARMKFSVPTNAGLVSGTIELRKLEARGLDGAGRFELRGELNPWSVETGDQVLDGHVARVVLSAGEGGIVFGSVTRLAPSRGAAEGELQAAPQWGAGVYLDVRRGSAYRELRYGLEVLDADRARLTWRHTASLAELGLTPPSHPFVEVTGPLTIELDAIVQRR